MLDDLPDTTRSSQCPARCILTTLFMFMHPDHFGTYRTIQDSTLVLGLFEETQETPDASQDEDANYEQNGPALGLMD